MFLSIIVPVYNVEAFLDDCLRSLSGLAGEDWEVIMVDDGSTDRSHAIAAAYDDGKRFRLITQENKGLSGARNTGLRAATGEYVSFVDSDDIVDAEKLGKMVSLCHDGVDILVGDYSLMDDAGNMTPDSIHTFSKPFPESCNGMTFLRDWYITASSVVWRNLYRRDFLLSNERLFLEGIHYEDVEWSINTFSVACRIKYCPESFYIYRCRSGSIMHSSVSRKKVKDAFFICRTLLADAKKHSDIHVRKVYRDNAVHCAASVLFQFLLRR